MKILKKTLGVLILILLCALAHAESFVVKKIQVNGLKRVSLATVLSYLSDAVKVGDTIDPSETTGIIKTLYDTNFFSDVALERRGNELIINVIERSVIGSLTLSGNHKITKKQLQEALKNVGIAEGQALDPAILNAIQRAIVNEYYNLGMYSAKVKIDVKQQERQRVAVIINVVEGPVAKIKSIKIVGNKAFSQWTLLKEFSLGTTKLWSFFTNADKYSQEKLDADLEKLRSYYMDRGYLHIKVDSSKVSITPDRKAIYIVINITEGPVYKLGGFSLDGNLLGKRQEILKLITLKVGTVFSRKDIIEAQGQINLFLSDLGYGMADIKADPDKIDEQGKKIWIKFTVDPGRRVYIRHINFIGNYKTNDDVLRREMRMQEGSLFSLSKINESARRLLNLGYIQDVDHKIAPVPETNNQVDLAYSLKETSAITASAQGGYSDRDGFIYGASLSDQNFWGTGKTVFIKFNNSKATQSYGIGYRNPYFTMNKVGLSINGYINKVDPHKISADLSSYTSSTYGGLISFDAPLSDYTQVNLGVGIEHISIKRGSNLNPKITNFLDRYGEVFNQGKIIAGLSFNNFDRALFPTKGFAHGLNGELYLPLNKRSLEFYKIDYYASWYQPLFMGFIFHSNAELGYGNGFGRSKELPFFKNFYAGGIGSVRGFQDDSIGDKTDAAKDQVVGANLLTLASASIIIPTPIKDILRPSIFIDVGNTYNNAFKPQDLRVSCGVQLEIRTPLAPLLFSFATPLKKKDWDSTQIFQFSISTSI